MDDVANNGNNRKIKREMNYKVTFRNSLLSATMTTCVEARSVEEAAKVVRLRYNLWHNDIISVESKNRNYETI